MQKRQEDLALPIRDLTWKAQLRLTHRYQAMSRLKKNPNIIMIAIARELVALMWAIFNELEIELAQ